MDTNMTRRNALTLIAGGLATTTARPIDTAAAPAARLVGYLVIIEGDQQFTGGEVAVTRAADGTISVAFVDEEGGRIPPST